MLSLASGFTKTLQNPTISTRHLVKYIGDGNLHIVLLEIKAQILEPEIATK